MKYATALFGILLWFATGQVNAQPGLKGEYYNGTNFDRKVGTRIDPAIRFNWRDRTPGKGVDKSYYSIRWTGKLLAPTTGQYGFYAKVDDGIRVWVGNKKVIDSWQLNDSKSFTGTVILQAGQYYDLRVDYFNAMLEGEIELYWQKPDAKKLVSDRFNTPSEPITAQYFFQKKPVAIVAPKPVSVPPKAPPVQTPKQTVTTPGKIAKLTPRPVRPSVVKPGAVPKPVSTTKVSTNSPAPERPVEPELKLTIGEPVVLRTVQFEQSSYTLLPESTTELNRLVQALKTNPNWIIDIEGHTDNVGDPRLNLALSENRAKVVATYLNRHGIHEDRIETKGYGGTQPIADNTTETGRIKNRRVAIKIR
ncbi:PA14 domain-containing protein [Spirosoma endbachense]|uniref:OmpA family protein n=1 Tax=Spirosoma endbachense TaxID=2666025 RepID=A0A6P1VQV5_9BACT|nr:PA14 domain-containing protein [Spirosoma endbachense]QHV94502.1 OmpA family protein [Spirosoma endbachense]